MPWVSLGSEVEVDMERVMPTRDLIKLEVVRARKYFGGPHCFSDRNSMTDYVEYNSYRDPNFELHRVELNMGVQVGPEE